MRVHLGQIQGLFRYPIKSMASEPLETAELGWNGIEGDRRLALHRVGDHGGFPWLTASKFPELILYRPRREGAGELITHVRTPDELELPIFSDAFNAHVGKHYGSAVEMMQMKNGIFDDASLSIIAAETLAEIGRLSGVEADVRRFRPNVLLRLTTPYAFQEDAWVGSVLCFGENADAPEAVITMRDLRCSMVNLDPDTAKSSPEVLKSIARANGANAGVYGNVTRTGRLTLGQPVFLRKAR